MNFKKFSFILPLLYLNSRVLSLPLTTETVDNSEIESDDEMLTFDLNGDDVKVIDIFTDDENIPTDSINTDDDECLTEECIETSKRILSSMDTSVNPCDDFYQFSCGGWVSEKTLKDLNNKENKRNIIISPYVELQNEIYKNINEIFEGDYKVDETLNKEQQEYDEKTFNKLKNMYNIFIILNKNDAINYELIYNSSTSLYNEIVSKILEIVYGNENNNNLLTDSIVNTTQKIVNLTNNDSYENINNITIESLNEKYPFMDWNLYISEILKDERKDLVKDGIIINIDNPEYFENFNDFIKEIDVDSFINYIEWMIINSNKFNEIISKDFLNLKAVIEEIMNDNIFYENRNIDSNILNERIYASKNAKCRMADEETKNYAIQKVLKMKNRIIYPDNFRDVTKLYHKSEELNINNYLDLFIAGETSIPSNDNEMTKSGEWRSTAFNVNSYYYLEDNSINIIASLLFQPFYYGNEQEYLSYDSLGFVIGHELTHAFDNTGRQYDFNGELKNWWTEKDSNEFNQLAQCFVDEYNSMTININGELCKVNGEVTLGENIADNGGLARAYDAWKRSLLNNPESASKHNKKLPGLSDYTFDQLFYIAFAQSNCSVESKIRIEFDEHSPGIARVNGVVSNSKHFAKAFNCPTKSPMNPESKCLLW